MSSLKAKRTRDEIARQGDETFELRVRGSLRSEDQARFVAIDVDTGDFEVDEDEYSAVMRLRGRRPDADIWLTRGDGSPAARMRLGK